MNKISLSLIQLLQNPQSILELSKQLSINQFETLQLIGNINHISNNLIGCNTNANYYLTRQINWINKSAIISKIHKSHELIILDETPSTNDYIYNNISNLADGTIVTCEYQSNGRGRQSNKWISSIANDITVSILYIFPEESNIEVLPLVCAIAITRLFKNISITTKIKWPNDIFYNNEKIAGLLIENIIKNNKKYTVIGIGIDNFCNFDRNSIISELINNLDNTINEFNLFGFSLLRQEWLDNCIHYKELIYLYKNNLLAHKGTHTDLSINGELVIQDNKKKIQRFISSNINLRTESQLHELFLDAGNSRIKIAIFKNKKLINNYILDRHQPDFSEFISNTQGFLYKNKLASSVIDETTNRLIENVIPDIRWILPARSKYGVTLAPYISIDEIGSDLWLIAIGAYNKTKKSTLVVSCGTAFVLIYISKIGQIFSCKITPGIINQYNLLTTNTSKIKHIQSDNYTRFPKNTDDAILSGILDGYLGMIQIALIDLANFDGIKTQPELIITGGYSTFISTKILNNIDHQQFDNLVIDGLYKIANEE